jgi:hypothetical protein
MKATPYLIKDLWNIVLLYTCPISNYILCKVLHCKTKTNELYSPLYNDIKNNIREIYSRDDWMDDYSYCDSRQLEIYYYLRSLLQIMSNMNFFKYKDVNIFYMEIEVVYMNRNCKLNFLHTNKGKYLVFTSTEKPFQYWVYNLNYVPKIFRTLENLYTKHVQIIEPDSIRYGGCYHDSPSSGGRGGEMTRSSINRDTIKLHNNRNDLKFNHKNINIDLFQPFLYEYSIEGIPVYIYKKKIKDNIEDSDDDNNHKGNVEKWKKNRDKHTERHILPYTAFK